MAGEQAELRLIREALEGVLAPQLVSTVLFEALEAHGNEVPSTPEKLRALIAGPLASVLQRRVGSDGAANVISHLEQILGTLAVEPESPPSRRDRENTLSLPTGAVPVPVLVIAGGRALMSRLEAALGPNRVAPWSGNTVKTVQTSLSDGFVAVAIIDASDHAPIEVELLAQLLTTTKSTVVCALWGSELPYGKRLVSAAQNVGVTLTAIDRSEGVEPLLDLIRSRHRKG